MPRKTQHSKELGRPEELSPKELLDRCKALKRFLEDNWGRIGLKLQRVRRPEDVRLILKIVPYVDSCLAFRDYPAACLLKDGATKIGWRELRISRKQHQNAIDSEGRLFSEHQTTRRQADEAATALKAAIAQFEAAISLFPFFLIAFVVAKELEVGELAGNANALWASYSQARQERLLLAERLSSQAAWFARNEVVRFVRNRRYEKSLVNFVKAMAGLPEYVWLHSLRRCSGIKEIEDNSLDIALNYQLFEKLAMIIKKTKPLQVKKVEAKLRTELLRDDAHWILLAHFGPYWWYIEQAFSSCVGKKISRKEMPYRLMAAIQDEIERPKTIPEQELAKHNQLIKENSAVP